MLPGSVSPGNKRLPPAPRSVGYFATAAHLLASGAALAPWSLWGVRGERVCSGWRATAAVVSMHADAVVIYLTPQHGSLMSSSAIEPYKCPLGFTSVITASGPVEDVGSAADAVVNVVVDGLAWVTLPCAALALGLAAPAALLRCHPVFMSALSVPSHGDLALATPLAL